MASVFSRKRNIATPLQPHNFSIVDVYLDGQDVLDLRLRDLETTHQQGDSTIERERTRCGRFNAGIQRFCREVKHRLTFLATAPSTWMFLVWLGILSAILAAGIDAIVAGLHKARYALSSASVDSFFGGYIVWVLWCIGMALGAFFITQWISPFAVGSGIPQMKTVLSGAHLPRYLSLRVLAAKILGLLFALGSGVSVGKEGPFVHIASIIAHHMYRIPVFGNIRASAARRRNMLAAGVAAGVTAVFGAPVGGVLFSIEVTATVYSVGNLWKAFVCAIACVFTFETISAVKQVQLFTDTTFDATNTISWQLLAFVFLGLLGGLLGSLFVFLASNAIALRTGVAPSSSARTLRPRRPSDADRAAAAAAAASRLPATATRALSCCRSCCSWLTRGRPGRHRDVVWVALLALATGVATYPAPYLAKTDRQVINDMFSVKPDTELPGWGHASPALSMLLFSVVKFVLTAVSISLPIPCGLFSPLFTFGAVFGRAYGELLLTTFPNSTTPIIPGAYAVVGAACVASGATHTLSTAVIVFELTGQLHHMLAVLLATLVSYSVAGLFTMSVYDVLLSLSGLPYLPAVKPSRAYAKIASDVMRRQMPCLTLSPLPTTAQLRGAVRPCSLGTSLPTIPVVEDRESMILVGCVSRGDILTLLSGKVYAPSDSEGEGASTFWSSLPVSSAAVEGPAGSGDGDSTELLLRTAQAQPDSGGGSSSHALELGGDLEEQSEQLLSSNAAAAAAAADMPRVRKAHSPVGSPIAVSVILSGQGTTSRRASSGALADSDGGASSESGASVGDGDGDDSDEEDNACPRVQFLPPFGPTPQSSSALALRVHVAPMQFTHLCPFQKLQFMFAMCVLESAFVTRAGTLVGVILREDICDA